MSQATETRDAAESGSPVYLPVAPSSGASSSYHIAILVLAALVLAASLALTVFDEETVGFAPLDWRMPGTCFSRYLFQTPCPGCGLTRSFISLAHGDWLRAWHFNPAGPFLFAAVLFQIPFRAMQLWRLRQDEPPLEWAWLNYASIAIGVLLVGQWLLGLFGVQF